jgi:hypothetical protein
VLTRIFGPDREEGSKELEAGENLRTYLICILHEVLGCVCKFYLKMCRENRTHALCRVDLEIRTVYRFVRSQTGRKETIHESWFR